MRLALWTVTFVTALAAGSASAAIIPASAARSHVGQHVTVQGVVSDAFHQGGSGATIIKVGGDAVFEAVFYTDSDGLPYPDPVSLPGRTVSVTGTLIMDGDTPEILVTTPSQIKVGH
ncbi:MAG: hypothetical protein ACREHE_14610 [Rhizomicrobium sp.]